MPETPTSPTDPFGRRDVRITVHDNASKIVPREKIEAAIGYLALWSSGSNSNGYVKSVRIHCDEHGYMEAHYFQDTETLKYVIGAVWRADEKEPEKSHYTFHS